VWQPFPAAETFLDTFCVVTKSMPLEAKTDLSEISLPDQ